jgi:hypothetical protein
MAFNILFPTEITVLKFFNLLKMFSKDKTIGAVKNGTLKKTGINMNTKKH